MIEDVIVVSVWALDDVVDVDWSLLEVELGLEVVVEEEAVVEEEGVVEEEAVVEVVEEEAVVEEEDVAEIEAVVEEEAVVEVEVVMEVEVVLEADVEDGVDKLAVVDDDVESIDVKGVVVWVAELKLLGDLQQCSGHDKNRKQADSSTTQSKHTNGAPCPWIGN